MTGASLTIPKRHVLLLALSALAMLALPARRALAQADTSDTRRVQIVTPADSLTQRTTDDGERVQQLIGDVNLRQGATRLRADRATLYQGTVLLVGDVLIDEEGDSLWADRVRYDRTAKVGRATGDVRVSSGGEVLLAGPVGRYFFNEKHAIFPNRVTLVDSARVLKSLSGEYFSREGRAEFYRDVRVFSDSTYLEADSVTYRRPTEVTEARGRVFIERRGDRADEEAEEEAEEDEGAALPDEPESIAPAPPDTLAVRRQRPQLLGRSLPVDTTRRALLPDTTARSLLWGERAYNAPREGYSRVTGRALLVRLQPPEEDTAAPPDTLIVGARRLETTRADTLRRLTATDEMRLWQRDLQAVADSAVYDRWPRTERRPETRQESRFFGGPLAWLDARSQLSGDSLRVNGRDGALQWLYARGNAFLAQEDSVLEGRHQQLKGRRIIGRFAQQPRAGSGETTLRRLAAGPNAEMIFFRKNPDGTLERAARASADTAIFKLRDGALRKLRMPSPNEGASYEAAAVPDPFRLDGFTWTPRRRPRKPPFLTQERVRSRLTRPAAAAAAAAPESDPPESDPPESE